MHVDNYRRGSLAESPGALGVERTEAINPRFMEDEYTRQLAAGFVRNADGNWIPAAMIEAMVEQDVEAIHHCMLVCHHTSDEVGCILTLRAAPGSAGVALSHAGTVIKADVISQLSAPCAVDY